MLSCCLLRRTKHSAGRTFAHSQLPSC
jgi:hypothetical protein